MWVDSIFFPFSFPVGRHKYVTCRPTESFHPQHGGGRKIWIAHRFISSSGSLLLLGGNAWGQIWPYKDTFVFVRLLGSQQSDGDKIWQKNANGCRLEWAPLREMQDKLPNTNYTKLETLRCSRWENQGALAFWAPERPWYHCFHHILEMRIL